MEIEAYQARNRAENYIVTRHSRQRLAERDILLRDVVNAVAHGEIIEEYPDDFPFPSCLILGPASGGDALHVVASMDSGMIYLITAYWPDPAQWSEDLRRRKEERQ